MYHIPDNVVIIFTLKGNINAIPIKLFIAEINSTDSQIINYITWVEQLFIAIDSTMDPKQQDLLSPSSNVVNTATLCSKEWHKSASQDLRTHIIMKM